MSQMHIAVSLDGAGHHPAAWREHDARPEELFSAERLVDLARLAELGALDFVTLGDSFALQSDRQDRVRGHLDALLSMARIAPETESIGLVATVTTTHTEPFHVSKNLATLDLVSGGRAGWLVDVSAGEAEALHFGRRQVAPVAELYAEAAEAIDVVGQLWDSWEDDAVIRDVSTGRYIDRDRLHYTNFEGRFFSVRGPSITPRSPQAQLPIVIRATDDHAVGVAAAHADVVVIDAATADEARRIRKRLLVAAASAGRDPDRLAVLAIIDVLLGETDAAATATRTRLDALAAPSNGPLDFVGSAYGLVELFDAWFVGGAVDGFLVRPATLPDTLRRLVDDVVRPLQHRGLFRTAYDGATLRERFGLARPANRYAAGNAHGPS